LVVFHLQLVFVQQLEFVRFFVQLEFIEQQLEFPQLVGQLELVQLVGQQLVLEQQLVGFVVVIRL